MSIDSHTENEASTLTFAILKQLNPRIAEDFAQVAFPHKQARENAETTLNSLTPNFISSLIKASMPQTTYPSIIYTSATFSDKENRKANLIRNRLKKILLSHRIVGHTRSVHQICLDPLNLMIFSGSDDSNIKCWHVPSLSLIITFKGHDKSILGMCISPDRRLFASFSSDKTVRLWSLVDGACVAVIYYQDIGDASAIEFSPCNRFLAIGSTTGVLRFLRISPLVQVLARAQRVVSHGEIPKNVNTGDLLFQDGETFSNFPEYDPNKFLKEPPTVHRDYYLKSMIKMVAFSPGGNLVACALESGGVIVVSSSTCKKWVFSGHETNTSCDGVRFLKNEFRRFISWSQKGGEIKLWEVQEKIKSLEILTFSVRYQSRRSHLIDVSLNCNETLIAACTSASLFVWKINSPTPILHCDDQSVIASCVSIDFHPKLSNIFLLATRSYIMLWDLEKPSEPFHILNIPIETHRMQLAKWSKEGLTIYASDAGGGLFYFRILESPDCRNIPEFFDSDFEPSEWVPQKGQVDENGTPTHLLSKSIITDSERVKIAIDFEPMSLDEVEMIPHFDSRTKYAWLNEELWLNSIGNYSKDPRTKPKSNMRAHKYSDDEMSPGLDYIIEGDEIRILKDNSPLDSSDEDHIQENDSDSDNDAEDAHEYVHDRRSSNFDDDY